MSGQAIADQAKALPQAPGVYLFKDAQGKVLYVGKADALRDRVRAYFASSLDIRFVRMVERAARLDYVLTSSVAEAYLLEANLIKQHRPRYNIRLKDDKSYPYVKVTLGEPFPRVLRTRKLGDRAARYFGPYANAKSVDESLDLLQKLFPHRTCTLTIVPDDAGKGRTQPASALPGGRPCLLFFIKRCTAPCVGNVTVEEYRRTIDQVVLFLEGRQDVVAREVRAEMERAAERLEFERAALLRDRLVAIERTLERQDVHAYAGDDFDIVAVAVSEPDACAQVFAVRDGTIVSREQFFLEGAAGATPGEVLASFARQHYALATSLPPEIVLGEDIPERESFTAFVSERRGARVVARVAQRGKKRHLAELAARNAQEALAGERARAMADRGKTETALAELQQALGLEGVPRRIECYDVSHVQGTDVVAAMVVFEDGVALRSGYRRFRVKGGDRNDDVGNLSQVLRRRFRRAGDAEAWPQPDLVIVDGGKPQLGAARDVLSELGRLDVQLAALAKEREELFRPERPEPIVLPRAAVGLYLVQRIRDEAHRFAVTYHRSLRAKRSVRSVLDDVAGIGPRRKRELLRRFGSVRGIREAAVEDIATVSGISPRLAERIKQAVAE